MMPRPNVWLAALVVVVTVGVAWWLGRSSRPPSPATLLTDEEQEVLARMNRLLPRDAIAPIYHPQFVPAGQARLRADELVLGVELNGEARAYPITVLNSREMVNDIVGGVPILATW